MISITEVQVTPDYAHAKVHFSSMGGEEGLAEVMAGLQRSSGFLRRRARQADSHPYLATASFRV